jgi:NAD-dependent DNA ligase
MVLLCDWQLQKHSILQAIRKKKILSQLNVCLSLFSSIENAKQLNIIISVYSFYRSHVDGRTNKNFKYDGIVLRASRIKSEKENKIMWVSNKFRATYKCNLSISSFFIFLPTPFQSRSTPIVSVLYNMIFSYLLCDYSAFS